MAGHPAATQPAADWDDPQRMPDQHDSPAYSPDGRRLATGDLDGRVAIWETRTGARLLVLSGPARIVSVAFSSDGSRLASGAGDGQVRLWDTHPARPRR